MDTLTTRHLASAASRDITERLREDIPAELDAAVRAEKRLFLVTLGLTYLLAFIVAIIITSPKFPGDPHSWGELGIFTAVLAAVFGAVMLWQRAIARLRLKVLHAHAKWNYGVSVVGLTDSGLARVKDIPVRLDDVHTKLTETRLVLGA